MGRTQPSRFGRVVSTPSTLTPAPPHSGQDTPANSATVRPVSRFSTGLIESLENRRMFASVAVVNSVLTVTGDTNDSNRLLVWSKSKKEVTVKVGDETKDISRAKFTKISVLGGAKADFISISQKTATPATVDGRGGNDTIVVPSGTNVVGGTPDDGGTDNPPPATGVIPSNNDATKPTAVITAVAGSAINAGQAVHVNAMASTLRAGSPITARYEWDFGDEGSDYNELVGFNAAHVYEKPGTYTLTLRVYNEDRGLDTETLTVTVKPAARTTVYVSNTGDDDNAGTSTGSPIKTWAEAVRRINGKDDFEVLFATGQTFTAENSMVLMGSNLLVGSYGTGAKPVIKFAGPKNRNVVIRSDAGATNMTVKGLAFDSIWNETDGSKDGMPLAIKPNGKGFNVLDNTFLNVGYAVNANSFPDGLLVQSNTAPLETGVRDYFVWAAGDDITILGNTVANVTREHVVRISGANRVNVTDNKLTNLSRTGSDRLDVAKGSLTVQDGTYAYIAGNTLKGTTGVGPLGEADGLANPGSRFRYAVYEANRTLNSNILIQHGAEHVALRNNIIEKNGGPGIEVDGYNSDYKRGVVDLLIANNTGLNDEPAGRFLWVGGSAQGIELLDNLYVAPEMYTGSYGTAAVFVNENNLNSFTYIDDNVWPVPTASGWAENGVNWVGTNKQDRTGYQNALEWNNWGKVGTDVFQNTVIDGKFTPTDNSLAHVTGTAYAGVFTDYYGALRPITGATTAGAVET